MTFSIFAKSCMTVLFESVSRLDVPYISAEFLASQMWLLFEYACTREALVLLDVSVYNIRPDEIRSRLREFMA